ncbi:MAG: hypothetical protein OXH15_13915 [Gammaproteobacteria bacterium]|nr:hypothetical protein [Gammaproteobacteria bacterium]
MKKKPTRIAAIVLVLAAAGLSWGGEFVEVSLSFKAQGAEIFSPKFIVETGQTADVRQSFNPTSENPAANPFGLEQRVLATVNRASTQGYGVHLEYMQRRGSHWVSMMQPTFHVNEYAEASASTSNAATSFNVTASVTSRYDVTSLTDLSCYRSSNAQCPVESSDDDTRPVAGPDEAGSDYFNPIGGPFGHHCCSVDCGNGNTLTCCNCCCSDEVLCPGKSCCA